jgi:hypothetical protein
VKVIKRKKSLKIEVKKTKAIKKMSRKGWRLLINLQSRHHIKEIKHNSINIIIVSVRLFESHSIHSLWRLMCLYFSIENCCCLLIWLADFNFILDFFLKYELLLYKTLRFFISLCLEKSSLRAFSMCYMMTYC